MMRLQLRPALEADFAFCESLSRANMASYHSARGIAWDPNRFRDSWARFDNSVITADGDSAGLLRLMVIDEVLEIRDLQVASAYRGLGIGTWAVAQAKSLAGSRGLGELRLRVYTDNPARHLYARLGFKADSIDDGVIHMSHGLPADGRTGFAGRPDPGVGPAGGRVSGLELKIPPDVVWIVVAAMMWFAAEMTPGLAVALPFRLLVAGTFAAAGVTLIVGARVVLHRARTAWHPTEPERTTVLVRGGVFRFSRNPIYLGMLFVLVGLAVVLANPLSLALTAIFALWTGRFQIRPEERVLSRTFGREYRDYSAEVRRWL